MKGRLPKPAEQRTDVDDPSHRPRTMPVVPGGRPQTVGPPPIPLTGTQATIFRRVCRWLIDARVLAASDVYAVALYAIAADEVVQLSKIIDAPGRTREQRYLAETVRGTWTANPLMSQRREAIKEARQYAAVLGLDVVGRARAGLKLNDRASLADERGRLGVPARGTGAKAAAAKRGIRVVDEGADDDDD